LPIDKNQGEQQIRPWATGRKNWLFAGTLIAGQRAAAITSLIQTAKLNGHDPYAYLKDVLTRLPTHKARDIDELLPHRWMPSWDDRLQRQDEFAGRLPAVVSLKRSSAWRRRPAGFGRRSPSMPIR